MSGCAGVYLVLRGGVNTPLHPLPGTYKGQAAPVFIRSRVWLSLPVSEFWRSLVTAIASSPGANGRATGTGPGPPAPHVQLL
eukprot:SAG11_NODE_440_length_9448_cov_3.356509_10_plen_82_part_00